MQYRSEYHHFYDLPFTTGALVNCSGYYLQTSYSINQSVSDFVFPYFSSFKIAMTSTPPLPDRKTKPSKMSRIGSNRRRTIEVSATMLRDILIGNVAGGPGEGNHHVLISASNEDLSCTLPPQVTVSKYRCALPFDEFPSLRH